jgi:hypothetical protein
MRPPLLELLTARLGHPLRGCLPEVPEPLASRRHDVVALHPQGNLHGLGLGFQPDHRGVAGGSLRGKIRNARARVFLCILYLYSTLLYSVRYVTRYVRVT